MTGFINSTYNHGLDFTPTVDEHAHAMSSRLIAGTVVGQNKGKVHGMFICIREKVPLLLGLIMDFVSAGTKAAKLTKENEHT
jgi:hypothetical protein